MRSNGRCALEQYYLTIHKPKIDKDLQELTRENWDEYCARRNKYLLNRKENTKESLTLCYEIYNMPEVSHYRKQYPIELISRLEKRIEKINRELKFLKGKGEPEFDNVTITTAKSYPVYELIEFDRRGKAPCLWHSEKTPSMHYFKKTNSVYCFGCHKRGDSIDVYMMLFSSGFKQAVKALNL